MRLEAYARRAARSRSTSSMKTSVYPDTKLPGAGNIVVLVRVFAKDRLENVPPQARSQWCLQLVELQDGVACKMPRMLACLVDLILRTGPERDPLEIPHGVPCREERFDFSILVGYETVRINVFSNQCSGFQTARLREQPPDGRGFEIRGIDV